MRTGSRLKKLRRNRDLDRLIDALSRQELAVDAESGVVDLSAQARADALAAIAELDELDESDDERIAEAVIQRLDDPIPEVRERAVRTLITLSPDRARDPLIAGLLSWSESYGDARLEAARALQELDDAGLLEHLLEEIASSNGSAVLDGITRRAIVSMTANGAEPSEVVGMLIDKLRGGEGNPRNLEIVLAWLGEYSVDVLVNGLDDPLLRESAATVLGALRESRGVPGLVRCLEDGRPETRLAAARALREIRDVRSVGGLIQAVSDEDFEVRCEAQGALDALGTVGVVAGVSAVLQLVMKDNAGELPRPGPDSPLG